MVATTSAALVRRDAFEAAGRFDPAMPSFQDWDLWLRLSTVGSMVVVSDPLVLFNQEDSHRMTKNHDQSLQGHDLLLPRRLALAEGSLQRARIYARHYLHAAEIHLAAGHAGKALANVVRSLAAYPLPGAALALIKLPRHFMP